jgi:PmbA protein
MNDLIERAREQVDAAELYWQREKKIDVRYENFALQQVTTNDLSSVALRVIDNGRLGLSYGTFPDQPDLLENAKEAAAHGGEADFTFSTTQEFPTVDTYDERSTNLSSEDLVSLCDTVKEHIRSMRPDLSLFLQCTAITKHLVIETTGGTHAEHRGTALNLTFYAPIKGAGSSVGKYKVAISPFDSPRALIDEFLEWYGWTEQASTPKTGRLPVILAPEASFLLTIPLCAGLSGEAIVKRTSPIGERLDETILSNKLIIHDDPLRDDDPASRAFDDEGVPCRRKTLVEKGALKTFLLDLHSASKLGKPPTGNGFKRALFASGIETPPNPWPGRIVIEPGKLPYKEMIAGLKEGLLLTGGMGFHSGNYPQGHFAVQALGYHIVDGTIKGRLERTMVSGNIYQDLCQIRAVSSEQKESAGGLAPYLLIDSLQVAGR